MDVNTRQYIEEAYAVRQGDTDAGARNHILSSG